MPKALVIYFSKSGNTRKMAEAITEGICKTGIEVEMLDVNSANIDSLVKADAIVLGSPTYYGSMAAEMKLFIDKSVKYHGKLQGKVGGAFSSSAMLGGGNETTVLGIIEALLIHGMVIQGHERISHYGSVSLGKPDEKALDECRKHGEQIGKLTLKLAKQ